MEDPGQAAQADPEGRRGGLVPSWIRRAAQDGLLRTHREVVSRRAEAVHPGQAGRRAHETHAAAAN